MSIQTAPVPDPPPSQESQEPTGLAEDLTCNIFNK